jgi:hypothetical protein
MAGPAIIAASATLPSKNLFILNPPSKKFQLTVFNRS